MGVEHDDADGAEWTRRSSAEEGKRHGAERSGYETTRGVGHFTGPHFVGELAGEDVGVASAETYLTPEGVPLGVSVTTVDGEAGAVVVLDPEQAERLGRELIERAEALGEEANEG